MSAILARALSECGQILSGGTPSRSDSEYWGGDIPWISAKSLKTFDVYDSDERLTQLGASVAALVPPGSILFVVRGMSLANEFRVGVTRREVAFNQDLRAIVPIPDVDGRYLARFLQASTGRVLELTDEASHGTKRLTADRVESIEVPVPELGEQRRIAEILDKADALRAKRRAALAQLDTLTQSIFVDMFGDPSSNSRDWPVCTIRELSRGATYGSSKKASSAGMFPVLRMGNLTVSGEMDFSALKYMNLGESEVERFTVQPGDILFNRTNSPDLVGKTAVFSAAQPMAYAGYLIRLRVNPEQATSEYVSSFLNLPYGKRVLRSMCKSIIGMANINATELLGIKIPKPPIRLQQAYSSQLAAVNRVKDSYRSALATLDVLFASLQHRAFRGEL